MTSIPKRRRNLADASATEQITLNRRAIEVLGAIEGYGGVLTTDQIAMLFWPPSLAHKLASWGLPRHEVAQLLEAYPPGYLNEYLELGKYLLRMQKEHKRLFHSFAHPLQAVASQDRTSWLRQMIAHQVELPELFVTRRQVRSEIVSSSCKHWLRKLSEAGYIESEEQATKLSDGRKPYLWFLTQRGRNFLAEFRGVPIKSINWKATGSFSPATLPHRLQNTDLRISTEVAAQHRGWRIRQWLDDEHLRKIHSRPSERVKWTRLSDPSDPRSAIVEEEGTVVADHYFWLDSGKNWHSFFECDRGTKTIQYSQANLNDFARKIRAYSAYYKSGKYFEQYPQAGKSFRVLIVTTSQERLRNLKQCIEAIVQEGGQSDQEVERGMMRYWLTTFEQIRPTWYDYFDETILTGKIWVRAGQSQRRPLIW